MYWTFCIYWLLFFFFHLLIKHVCLITFAAVIYLLIIYNKCIFRIFKTVLSALNNCPGNIIKLGRQQSLCQGNILNILATEMMCY